MTKLVEAYFTDQNLMDALREQDIPDIGLNLNRLVDNLMGESHNIEAIMLEAGWSYILDTIQRMEWKGKFFMDELEPRCPRCGCPLIDSEVVGYTYTCPNCDEDFYSFEAR